MNTIRMGSTKEKPLQASKWLSLQALLDTDELKDLLESLGEFYLARCGAVCNANEGLIAPDQLLAFYEKYVRALKNRELPNATQARHFLSLALTKALDDLYAIPLENEKQILRICKPVIQLQANYIDYSFEDKKFRPMIFGMESIPWGIQFSYPQLFQNSETKAVEQVKNNSSFPNSALYHTLQKWIRQHTIPTPFEVEGHVYNVPIRLGKKCLSWINQHPQLSIKGIKVTYGTI